ncbi:MAG: hypothetical protein JWO33_1403 [Caulobacteraceae bacterium]|nr:hypothetical protein [Caulobacteraceae bacterium]
MANALTSDIPVAPAQPGMGTILLARHGEPALSRRVRLNAAGYRGFWANYEIGGLAPSQSPPPELVAFVSAADVVIASTRRRSIESAEILGKGRAFETHPLLIEAPLPPPPWPAWVRLSPKLWGFWARFHWWFFNHHAGEESRREAEVRADQVATLIIARAETGQSVAVVAHGFFNVLIGRALKRHGWRMTRTKGYKYWSTRRFEKA